jgi:hypothetical protein
VYMFPPVLDNDNGLERQEGEKSNLGLRGSGVQIAAIL